MLFWVCHLKQRWNTHLWQTPMVDPPLVLNVLRSPDYLQGNQTPALSLGITKRYKHACHAPGIFHFLLPYSLIFYLHFEHSIQQRWTKARQQCYFGYNKLVHCWGLVDYKTTCHCSLRYNLCHTPGPGWSALIPYQPVDKGMGLTMSFTHPSFRHQSLLKSRDCHLYG